MAGYTLSAELQGRYKVVNTHMPCLEHPQLGRVDFRTMTAEQADALITAGTMYLVKIKKRKAATI